MTERTRIISNLYWQQTVEVKLESATTEASPIKKGIRQECVLLPLLFNIYSEIIFKEVLEGVTGDIKINGKAINNIRYANGTIVLAEKIQDLQDMMDRIVQCSESFDLSMYTAKTKVLVFSKTPMHAYLTIKGITMEQVPSFKYLGTIVTNQNDHKKEIRSRIEQARRTFVCMRKFFTRSDLSLELRLLSHGA